MSESGASLKPGSFTSGGHAVEGRGQRLGVCCTQPIALSAHRYPRGGAGAVGGVNGQGSGAAARIISGHWTSAQPASHAQACGRAGMRGCCSKPGDFLTASGWSSVCDISEPIQQCGCKKRRFTKQNKQAHTKEVVNLLCGFC
ncbi:hypothetical protein SRHO_G00111670 [Serrasalmus rhombeus]